MQRAPRVYSGTADYREGPRLFQELSVGEFADVLPHLYKKCKPQANPKPFIFNELLNEF